MFKNRLEFFVNGIIKYNNCYLIYIFFGIFDLNGKVEIYFN